MRWSATTKVNRALIPLARRLAGAGLATVEIGVEAISRRSQDLFQKRADPAMVEEVIFAFADAGTTVVVNLIFGSPGESALDAQAQLDWFRSLQRRAPAGRVDCSLNALEIARGSPLAIRPPPGVRLLGAAPWAFTYAWNAPGWRREFLTQLRATELARAGRPE